MTTKLGKIKDFVSSHKKTSIFILIVIVILGYWGFEKVFAVATPTQYITTTVAKGNVIETITGSGQVSTSNQVNLQAKGSGTIVSINAKPGDVVKRGKVLIILDSSSAQKAVRDAQINLQNAQLSLDTTQIQNSSDNLNAALQKSYGDGFTAVSGTFLDLSPTLSGLDTLLASQNLSDNAARNSGKTALNYRKNAEDSYYKVQKALDKNIIDFRSVNRNSSSPDIKNILDETYTTTGLLSDAIKNTRNFVDYMSSDTGRTADYSASQGTLSSYTNTIDGHLSSLLGAETNIKSSEDTVISSGLNLQGSSLSLVQKQNALQDAKDALANYYVTAPFDGTISAITAKVGDSASGSLGTIITNQELATISLNEVDIAKIKLGQKVTLTFDAIDGLTITGTVSQIDAVGTVSQGVVSYNVQINFDIMDPRVKPGMSVSSTIITNTAQDVLVVPNAAIKIQNGQSYVETFSSPLAPSAVGAQGSVSAVLPQQVQVQTGLVDDTNTEIISGLNEGDIVVTKTITGSTTKTTTAAPSILGAIGGNKGGGGGGAGALRGVTAGRGN